MRFLLKATLAVALVASTLSLGFGQQPPPNSYLEKRVNSTAQLIQQVQSMPVVMDRYRRHFAMSNDEVVDYLSTLRVSTLSKDGVFTVYGVPHSSGDFHSHLRLLKKGEPVFIEPDGTPVLQLVCGNPLILGPKKPVTPNPLVVTTGTVEGTHDVTPEAAPAPSPAAPVAAVPGTGPMPEPTYRPSSSSPLPMLLGLAGSVGFFISRHHSPPTVPEPMSVLVIGAGLAVVAFRRKFKKSA